MADSSLIPILSIAASGAVGIALSRYKVLVLVPATVILAVVLAISQPVVVVAIGIVAMQGGYLVGAWLHRVR